MGLVGGSQVSSRAVGEAETRVMFSGAESGGAERVWLMMGSLSSPDLARVITSTITFTMVRFSVYLGEIISIKSVFKIFKLESNDV